MCTGHNCLKREQKPLRGGVRVLCFLGCVGCQPPPRVKLLPNVYNGLQTRTSECLNVDVSSTSYADFLASCFLSSPYVGGGQTTAQLKVTSHVKPASHWSLIYPNTMLEPDDISKQWLVQKSEICTQSWVTSRSNRKQLRWETLNWNEAPPTHPAHRFTNNNNDNRQ